MEIPDEVGTALRREMRRKDLGSQNVSTIDPEIQACCMRVLARRGLGPFSAGFIWPVISVTVQSGPDSRRFTIDVRDLVEDAVEVDEAHPIWTSMDDDDWNGATAGQWLLAMRGKRVVLVPPPTAGPELLERVREALRRNGAVTE